MRWRNWHRSTPSFVSVTYGAGGSTRERTHATVARIIAEAGIPAAAHLTCVDATKAETRAIAERYWEAGVRHIVALRGDAGEPGAPFTPHPEGYASAADLVTRPERTSPTSKSPSPPIPRRIPTPIARKPISTI